MIVAEAHSARAICRLPGEFRSDHGGFDGSQSHWLNRRSKAGCCSIRSGQPFPPPVITAVVGVQTATQLATGDTSTRSRHARQRMHVTYFRQARTSTWTRVSWRWPRLGIVSRSFNLLNYPNLSWVRSLTQLHKRKQASVGPSQQLPLAASSFLWIARP